MFKRSECWGEKPDEIEITPTCVFVRKDFKEIKQNIDEDNLSENNGWEYLEEKITYNEYLIYSNQQTKLDLLDIQEAIIELYEQMIGENDG